MRSQPRITRDIGLRHLLRRIRAGLSSKQPDRETLHHYWRKPPAENEPTQYLNGIDRSNYFVTLIAPYVERTACVLELGCNVGRNLEQLRLAGFHDLAAIEINTDALKLLADHYPDLHSALTVYNEPIEVALPKIEDGSYDLVFTMAVLEHIHNDSAHIFAEMTRICRDTLVTIEDEKCQSWRHFPRNYRTIFETLGMVQVTEARCAEHVASLGSGFRARVFKKQ